MIMLLCYAPGIPKLIKPNYEKILRFRGAPCIILIVPAQVDKNAR